MESALKVYADATKDGLEQFVIKGPVTPAAMSTVNARTELVFALKAGTVDIVLCVSLLLDFTSLLYVQKV